MHMLKGPPTLYLNKFPRRISLALEKTTTTTTKNWPIDRPGWCSSE